MKIVYIGGAVAILIALGIAFFVPKSSDPRPMPTTSVEKSTVDPVFRDQAVAIASATAPTGTTWQSYQKPSDDTLATLLTPLAYAVTQEEGTERPESSPYNKNYERGIYVDILSGEPLFSSRDKYDSGTGWPSFTQPISPTAVTEHTDTKLSDVRIEIRSTIADNHLGHVFPDGPVDRSGLRYCMNGIALNFIPEAQMAERGYSEWLESL